jgi:putative transcriptional regulator
MKSGSTWRFAMTYKTRYGSEIAAAVHSAVEGMYETGIIDHATMHRFDESCLAVPAPLAPKKIKKIRLSQKVSQPVFDGYLNTSESTIEKRESGAKKHRGLALKLLSLVENTGCISWLEPL